MYSVFSGGNLGVCMHISGLGIVQWDVLFGFKQSDQNLLPKLSFQRYPEMP